MRSQRGMTLVGMLVAITVPAATLAAVAGTLESQSTPAGYVGSPDDIVAQLTRPVCAVNAVNSVPFDQQPLVVYASAFRFSYEIPCPPAGSGDQLASWGGSRTPASYASTGQRAAAWLTGSSASAPVDTVTFFFQDDRSTARTDDFVLMRQVNGRRAEPALRNVLAYPGRPFFQYYYRKVENGHRTTQPVPGTWLPLQHTSKHGAVADTGVAARIDTLRAIEVNYSVTNGRTGAAERVSLVSVPVAISSLGQPKRRPCGDGQVFSQASFVKRAAYGWDTDDDDASLESAMADATRGACSGDW